MGNRKLLFTGLLAACFYFGSNAQLGWGFESGGCYSPQQGAKVAKTNPTNFYDIQNSFYTYWSGQTPAKGSGYKPFKRWEAWWLPQVYPTGNFPPLDQVNAEVEQYKLNQNVLRSMQSVPTANWTAIGPFGRPQSGTNGYVATGSGRINCIEFDPLDVNTMWAGTPAGGLWKSTDAGANWTSWVSFPQSDGVSDIAIAPSNHNTMYIASGDADEGQYAPTRGVWKSTDGGANWSLTGLTYNLTDQVRIYKIIVHPTNPNIVIAALAGGDYTKSGLWRTTDGGATWSRATWYNPVQNAAGYYGCAWSDLEFKPGDPNTVYAAKYGSCDGVGVWKSTDGGATFNYCVTFGSSCRRIALGVSAANPSVVYALCSNDQRGFYGLYKSTDAGANFSFVCNSPNIFNISADGSGSGGQGEYDNNITVNPGNANELYVGTINFWKSTDGGSTWTRKTYWNQYAGDNSPVVHADFHAVEFVPGTTNSLYVGNDGGMYKTTDGGNTWTDANNGINAHLFERISDFDGEAGTVLGGAQDNSSFLLKGGVWKCVGNTGDGEDCMIDNTNSSIIYTTAQNGVINKSTDGGLNYQYNIQPANGAWATPIIMNYQNHNTIYGGFDKVYKSTDAGTSWNPISPDLSGGNSSVKILFLAIDNSGNTIYASTSTALYKTTDGGLNWSNVTGTLPVSSAMISGIHTTSFNGNNIWVTFDGYAAGQKVYFSNNGGSSWSNISGTLPNVPAHCVVYDGNSSLGATYLGTNIGVFYKDNTLNDWALFNTGLPDIPVTDLDINPTAGKLRAGTRGRGMWETPVATVVTPPSPYGSCSTLKQPVPSITYYTYNGGNGYVVGTNNYQTTKYAEYYVPDNSYTHVMGASFDFNKGVTSNPGTAKVVVTLWKNDGPNGTPGTVLATKNLLISTIGTNVSASSVTNVTFTNPVAVTTPYYLGFEWFSAAGDTVSLRNSTFGAVTTNTAWVLANNVWEEFTTWFGTTNNKTSIAAYAVVGTVPVVSFSASPTSGGTGTQVTFSNTTSGGNSFKWYFSGGTPATSTSLSPTVAYNTAGTYNVKLVAYGSCNAADSLTKSGYIVIGAPAATYTVHNVSCNGGNDGSIDVTVSGTNTYLWSNGATTQDISGVTAGTYSLTITSGSSTSTLTVTVTQPNAMAVTNTPVNVTCNGGNNGSITTTVSGGTAPYTYAWNTGATTKDISGLTAGTYTLVVTATGGCSVTKTVTVSQPTAISLTATPVNATCGSNNGAVNLTVSGGTSPYTYAWSNGSTTQNISSLGAGTYSVTVTDNNTCTKTASATITQPSSLNVSIGSVTNVSCNGGNNGAINLTVSGGTTPYTYNWSNGATTQNVTGLAAGTFSVAVHDASGCTFNTSATITQPSAIAITLGTIVNVSCNGGNNGSIPISVSGGTAPYTYLWSNATTAKDLINAPAGTYTVTVTGTGGCAATANGTITQPPVFAASIKTITGVSCNGGNNGSVEVNVNGGTSPYTFLWSNNATTQNINGLSSGTYSLTATDKNGCVSALSANVSQPVVLTASVTSVTNVSCTSATNGAINISVSGGTAPYTYLWNNGATTQNISSLASGPYSVTVTDAKNCQTYITSAVSAPAALTVSVASKTDVTCNGGSNGAVNISVSGGTAPYSYNWSNGATTQNLSNVIANTYSVTVTSQGGCTAGTSSTVSQPAAIQIVLANKTNVSCNGGNNGAINVTVTGGTTPYTYSWSNGATTANISGLGAGTYTLTVSGAGGNCSSTFTTSITQPAILSGAISNIINASCGGNNGSMSFTASGGTTPYSYLWSNGATTQNITGLAAGVYSVTATDANGCTVNKSANITQPSSLSVVVTASTNVSCNGGSNGSIDITVSGGTPGYTFAWTGPSSYASSAEDISGLAAGGYTVTVTDGGACTFVKSVVITQAAPLTASIAGQTNVSCSGGNNGSIDLSVNGGTAPYTYAWSNSATVQDPSGLISGPYSVTVTAQGGCTATASVTVTQPAAITATYSKTNVTCNGFHNGAINITVAGGTAPYTFAWSNNATTEDINLLGAGTYVVNITDAKGCTGSLSVAITQPAILSATIQSVQNANCNSNSGGSIDLKVTGGIVPYTYAWSNGSSAEDPENLTAGAYNVTVTDSAGCTATASATVSQPQPPTVSLTNVKNVDCAGGSNGAISVSVSGGILPITYSWSNGATTKDLSGIAAGNYVLTVNSGGGCTRTLNATITEPSAITASATATNVTCNGGTNGAVNLTVSGGTSPYTFLWSNNAATQNLSGVGAATYSVTIKDSKNCTQTSSATVTQPSAVSVVVTNQTNSNCGATTGSINVTASGGTGSYTYSWSNGATTEDLSGLGAGSYSVIVKDAGNCSATVSATITQPSSLSATVSKTDVSCNGGNNGSVTLAVSGGTGPYTFSWSNSQSTQNISNLTAGTYTVAILDASNCAFNTSAQITQPAVITASIGTITQPSCTGGNNGSIVLNVTGGTTPYTYQWSNNTTAKDPQNLTAGNYSVVITDNKGCTSNSSATVTDPSQLAASIISSVNVSCFGSNSGSINLGVSGSLAPYTYNWSNGAATEDLNNLSAGTYSVTVTSAKGCTATASATITQPTDIQITIKTQTGAGCNGSSNGSVEVLVSGGTAPYTYIWNNGATTASISNLSAGNYSVTVNDAKGCSKGLQVTISQSNSIAVSGVVTDPTCSAGSNGQIIQTVSGGSAPYTYLWNNSAVTKDVTALTAGTYSVTITDAAGCATTKTYTLTAPNAVVVTSLLKTNVNCNGGNTGAISVAAGGGTGPYTYLWSNSSTNASISNLTAASYSVTATDSKGCTGSAAYSITQPSVLAASVTSFSNVTACSSNNGSIDLTVSGGTTPYTYSWSNGATTQDLTGLAAGAYVVSVTDANNCTASANKTITQPGSLAVVVTSTTNVSCNSNQDGAIDITPSGATSYTYSWSNGETTEDITGVGAGTYVVTVTDNNSCSFVKSISITEPAALTAGVSVTQAISCNGGNNGALSVTAGGGAGSYTYLWSNSNTTSAISSLNAGSYSVTVTDANSCTASASYLLAEPGLFQVSVINTTDVTCASGNNGAVKISVNGGTSPFTYSWSNGESTQNIAGVIAGIYSVTVTDAHACTATVSATVNQPAAISITKTITNVTTNGGNNGAVDITVSGGVAAYTYSWNNGSSAEDISGLIAGVYSVTVTDANACVATLSATVTQPGSSAFCSGTTTLTATSGTFNDGSGASLYGTNANCYWLIQPSSVTDITLSFSQFNTELNGDYVTIYDGPDTTAPVIAQYSGGSIPFPVMSSGNTMLVRFTSNNSVNDSGWVADYTTTAVAVAACSGTTSLTAPSGAFSDGSGASNYNSNSDCQWLIEPPGATSITLKFTSFDTENGYDFVTVYDGADANANVLASFTGTSTDSVVSSGGKMFVVFTSDYSINGAGWDAVYNSSNAPTSFCSGLTTFTASAGSFGDGSGAANYGPNSDCQWLIQPAGASGITLTFSNFHTENSYDFVYVYDGATTADPLLGTFSGDSLPSSITSTSGSMLVYFSSDYSVQMAGWYANYTSITPPPAGCSGTTTLTAASGTFDDGSGPNYNYSNLSNCSWLIQPPGATNINLSFNSFDIENGYDFVYVYDGVDATGTLLGTYTGSNLPASVTVVSGNMFLLFSSDSTVNTSGWSATYNSNSNLPTYCSGSQTLTAPSGTFNDGSGPNDYFEYADCYWLIQPQNASSITVDFNSFATENGYDSVYVYDGVSTSDPLLGAFTGSSLPPQMISTGGSVLVHFVSDYSTNDAGWEISYNATIVAPVYCSGVTNLTAVTDTFSDGSGINNYVDNSRCQWLIQPAGANKITLNFTDFDIENSYDYVYVYDGADTTAPLLGSFTGSTIPAAVQSTGGSMLVYFYSDISTSYTGWTAYYDTSSTVLSSGCSGITTLTAPSGSFSDGSGAANYADNGSCSWLIQPGGATAITLTFNSFETESGYDFVRVYDGADTSAALLGEFSGNTIPSSITSSGGSMFVWFSSDYSTTAAGWDATYNSTAQVGAYCSGTTTLTAPSGSFDDGSGPSNDYVENSSCSWLIQPAGAVSITLTFNSFSTENGYDSVYVYDGANSAASLLGSYTGSSIPPVLTSTGGNMFVQFRSDYSMNAAGWDATYTSLTAPAYCSGQTTLTAISGTFTDGSGNTPYLDNSDCSWLIQPAGATTISLNFPVFNTEYGYDSVTVYDGIDGTAPVLGSFTGNSIPPQVNSTGGSMFVRFLSDFSVDSAGWTAVYNSDAILSIQNSLQTDKNLSVKPNPTTGQFSYSFSFDKETDVSLSLYSVIGQLVWQQKLNNVRGEQQGTINIENYVAGVYFLQLRAGDKYQVIKVVKE